MQTRSPLIFVTQFPFSNLITSNFTSSVNCFLFQFCISSILANSLLVIHFCKNATWAYHCHTRRQHNYALCRLCINWVTGAQWPVSVTSQLWKKWHDWSLIPIPIHYFCSHLERVCTLGIPVNTHGNWNLNVSVQGLVLFNWPMETKICAEYRQAKHGPSL